MGKATERLFLPLIKKQLPEIVDMAAFSFSGVASLPNWPTKAGATQAITFSPRLMVLMIWKIWLLSAMAAKGQLTKHIPQETHLS